MLRILHCLHSRLTDGGKLSTLSTGRALLPRNIIFLLSKPQGLVRSEELGKLKKKAFTSLGLEPTTYRLVA
jgi:hypothetical protein